MEKIAGDVGAGRANEPAFTPVQLSTTTKEAEKHTEKSGARAERRIRLLQIIKSTLSSLLSLAIGIFQARIYITFQNSRTTPGAWPESVDVAPTLLLLSTAVAALVFDICLMVGHLLPGKKHAQRAFAVATAASYAITSAKAVSYGLSAVVSRTSFNFGNASGQNNDLWSWTCTEQAATMNPVNHAESNCNTQLAAWTFALAQVAIEAFGMIISALIWWQRRAATKDTPEERNERLGLMSGNIDQNLNDATPDFKSTIPI
jgi:hypothetical protein